LFRRLHELFCQHLHLLKRSNRCPPDLAVDWLPLSCDQRTRIFLIERERLGDENVDGSLAVRADSQSSSDQLA
jgi:hypothetical protein